MIQLPNPGDFLLFSKKKKINSSSLTGYYAKARLANNSHGKVELFSLGSEIHESSK